MSLVLIFLFHFSLVCVNGEKESWQGSHTVGMALIQSYYVTKLNYIMKFYNSQTKPVMIIFSLIHNLIKAILRN